MQDLRLAIGRLQLNNSRDQNSVPAELLRHVPKEFFDGLVSVFEFRVRGQGSSKLLADSLFSRFAEKKKVLCMQLDVRPIANLRLLYKVFRYSIFRRTEHTLDTHQLKNDMDSAQSTSVKSTCTQPSFFKKRQRTEYAFGYSVSIGHRHLTVCIGQLFRVHCMLRAFRII